MPECERQAFQRRPSGAESHPSRIEAPGQTQAKAPDTLCRNLPGWTDSGGLQCFHYASNNWCTDKGKAGSAWKREWGEIWAPQVVGSGGVSGRAVS